MEPPARLGPFHKVAHWLLAGLLLVAGVGHLINAQEFLAQVPPWLPYPGVIVAVSGVFEIALAVSLVALPTRRALVGWIVAAFFIVVFRGNISQFVTHTSAFGLDSDLSRGIRLLLQPVLVAWALWCTGAWQASWLRRRMSELREKSTASPPA